MTVEITNHLKQNVNDTMGQMGSSIGGYVFLIANDDPNLLGRLAHIGPNPEYVENMLCDTAAKAYTLFRTRTGATPEQAWEVIRGKVMNAIVRNRF